MIVTLDDHCVHLKGQDRVQLADRLLGDLLLEEVGGGADDDPFVGMGHVAQRQEVTQGLPASGPRLDDHVLGLVVGVVIVDAVHHLGLDRPDGQVVTVELGLPPLGRRVARRRGRLVDGQWPLLVEDQAVADVEVVGQRQRVVDPACQLVFKDGTGLLGQGQLQVDDLPQGQGRQVVQSVEQVDQQLGGRLGVGNCTVRVVVLNRQTASQVPQPEALGGRQQDLAHRHRVDRRNRQLGVARPLQFRVQERKIEVDVVGHEDRPRQ